MLLVLREGLEPSAYRLQGGCSTVELSKRIIAVCHIPPDGTAAILTVAMVLSPDAETVLTGLAMAYCT